MKTVYIALGSNVGDAAANLKQALTLFEDAKIQVLRASPVFETAPQGLLNQPWFLNQVVEAETSLLPRQLLKRLLTIERSMGRKRTVRNGPRTIDLDIVLYGKAVVDTPDLQIPHPRMAERRFVLEPLAALVPDLRHPITKQTVREMLAQVRDQQARQV